MLLELRGPVRFSTGATKFAVSYFCRLWPWCPFYIDPKGTQTTTKAPKSNQALANKFILDSLLCADVDAVTKGTATVYSW